MLALKIFITTYALSLFFDFFKTIAEILINFRWKTTDDNTYVMNNHEVCFIIPCHNSEYVIRRTIATLPKEYMVVCVANACTDNTVKALKFLKEHWRPNMVIIETEKPGKMNAVLQGVLLAKSMRFTEFILIDDDVIWPHKPLKVSYGAKATGLPVIPLYPKRWIEVVQTIEYLYMVVSKRAQGLLGNTIMASGAAGFYQISTFLNVLKYHDGEHIGDDLQCAHIHHSLGYKIDFKSELAVRTEVPGTFKEWWRQRAKRWEISPIYNFRWIFKTIFGEKTFGWWIRWIAFYRIFVFCNDLARIVSLPYVIMHFPGTLVGVWAIAYASFALKATTYYSFYKEFRYPLSPAMVWGILTYPVYSSLMWVSRLWAIPNGIVRTLKRKPGGIYA